MEGGPSKIDLPNSHPSNLIHAGALPQHHKAAQAESASASTSESTGSVPLEKDKMLQHEINKTAVIIGVVGLGALLFMAVH